MRRSFSASDLRGETKRIDSQIRLVHKQIAIAERCLAGLMKDFSNLTVDLTKVHGRQLELCHMLKEFADEESPTLKDSLTDISDYVMTVADVLSSHVHALENRIVHPISSYTKNCKQAREELEQCSNAKKKNMVAMKCLEKVQSKPAKTPSKSELKAQETVQETAQQIQVLENKIKDFERRKAVDIRQWLNVYIHSSLAYHVKAVEEYTKAYQALRTIDIEEHVENFSEKLMQNDESEQLNIVRRFSLNTPSKRVK